MKHKLEHRAEEVSIELLEEGVALKGVLTVPENAVTLVIFAHGSGSSRFSPRNQYVAKFLIELGLSTLLMDLLTPEEEATDLVTAEYRFDIPLLARRLKVATDWANKNKSTEHLKIGYFGSSTGAAAALIAAADLGNKISAVVSRGGRPDMAAAVLPKVVAPTLLIVGGNDFGVIELNKQAFDLLTCEKKMDIVPGATHLFEEPGTLAEVAKLAGIWFKKYQ